MAAASTTTSTMRLKLLIEREGKRVVCAEGGKDFVDFLFYILLLLVETVLPLLTKEGMVDCLGNLYRSVENLGGAYILPTTDKKSLLKPKYSLNVQSSTRQGLYKCSHLHNDMLMVLVLRIIQIIQQRLALHALGV
ncbi:hypothetical protein HRI_002377600 [Hibiscus trionum]|uniref:Uncharacterized protein n=1 Tax=Hibiscus trionum TaxID=183268 RepID=A0A9W7I2R7_HIBTR|nr:hypothetical protein HRI_002377600 [Hibiscus trionum]